MCRSVPQIAVFSTLIRTSFGPGTGTGTSSIHRPLAVSRLTSAFMVADIGRRPAGTGGHYRLQRKPRACGKPAGPAPGRAATIGRSFHLEPFHAPNPAVPVRRDRPVHRPSRRRGGGDVGPAAAAGDLRAAQTGRPEAGPGP